MLTELKLAYRNLIGAKLRTWLNVGVLSLVYVLVIWHMAIFNGMNNQAVRNVIEQQVGGGQYWYDGYDPNDPLIDLSETRGVLPEQLRSLFQQGRAAPVLIGKATIYPQGRSQSVLIKGIDPKQTVLQLPTDRLVSADDGILPVAVGKLMAKSKSLREGDTFIVRWRDKTGTFDAAEAQVVAVMNTMVPAIDAGQIWVPLDRLQSMFGLENTATYVVLKNADHENLKLPNWNYKPRDILLEDIKTAVNQKRAGSIVMYAILLSLILLAVFDTQVLSIFRRRKEIGTLMALGLTRHRVVSLFTLEGAFNGVLAMIVATIYGIPLWILSAFKGLPLPDMAEESGLPIPPVLYPEYSISLIIGTVIIVMIAVTAVSYLPSRKIARMTPTEALRGKS